MWKSLEKREENGFKMDYLKVPLEFQAFKNLIHMLVRFKSRNCAGLFLIVKGGNG
jgi:hypothetical protein